MCLPWKLKLALLLDNLTQLFQANAIHIVDIQLLHCG